MSSVTNEHFMLSVVLINVILLIVVASSHDDYKESLLTLFLKNLKSIKQARDQSYKTFSCNLHNNYCESLIVESLLL
jgi:hypothetical protein